MSTFFEAAETHYNVNYNETLKIMEGTENSTSGEVYVILDESTFLLLNSSDYGKLFKALYEDTINSVLSAIENEEGNKIDIEKIINIIPVKNDLPLISKFLNIEIDDTFIFLNNGDVLSVVNNLLEPENIEEFNKLYDVEFSDIEKL